MPSSNTQPHKSLEVATVPLSEKPSWQIKLLYDGECPLCVREVNFLRKRDAGRGKVTFVDIADDDYTPSTHGGVDFETAMGRIPVLSRQQVATLSKLRFALLSISLGLT